MSNVMSYLDFFVNPERITVFSKDSCGYCKKTMQLFKSLPVKPYVIDIEKINDDLMIRELVRVTKQSTVPNIFVYGKHIGGYNELVEMYNNNLLQEIISQNALYICEICGVESKNKNLKCGCFSHNYDDWGRII